MFHKVVINGFWFLLSVKLDYKNNAVPGKQIMFWLVITVGNV